ncbi:MAG: radical SAM protein [Clostridium sp.]|nr:radical SAM protein [Clostridium sp.]
MMANIVITDVCNLHCPYCFASEFVNKEANEISMDAFRQAKEFILSSGCKGLGIIGGEPLLHSAFKEILEDIIYDGRVQKATVFTNGIHCDEYLDQFSHEKFRFLINCNSPTDTGVRNYEKLCGNLELMIEKRYMKNRISLGINMYKPDFEYEYLLKLLDRYHFDNLRVSITVPNGSTKRGSAFDDFRRIKPRMLEFFNVLLSMGIRPRYDCNKLPSCLFEWEDYRFLEENIRQVMGDKKIHPNMAEVVRCRPVVDILQDLTAIRCFGLSQYTKADIRDFRNLDELKEYYRRTVDSYGCNTVYHEDCTGCRKRLNGKCYGGCLVYKIDSILKMQEYSEELMAKAGDME